MLLKCVLTALAAGYLLCVVAKKQEGLLKSLGYTIGISIIVLGLGFGLTMANSECQMKGKPCHMPMMKGKPCMMIKK